MDIDKVILKKFIPLWYNQQLTFNNYLIDSWLDDVLENKKVVG